MGTYGAVAVIHLFWLSPEGYRACCCFPDDANGLRAEGASHIRHSWNGWKLVPLMITCPTCVVISEWVEQNLPPKRTYTVGETVRERREDANRLAEQFKRLPTVTQTPVCVTQAMAVPEERPAPAVRRVRRIHCPVCDVSNSGTLAACFVCGADLSQSGRCRAWFPILKGRREYQTPCGRHEPRLG